MPDSPDNDEAPDSETPSPTVERRWRPASGPSPPSRPAPEAGAEPPPSPDDATATDPGQAAIGDEPGPPDASPDPSELKQPPGEPTDAEAPPSGVLNSGPSDPEATPDGDAPAENMPGSGSAEPPNSQAEPGPAPDADEEQAAGKQINEEALSDDADDRSWAEQMQDRHDDASREPPAASEGDEVDSFFTDEHRHVPGAEQVEEELQDFAYDINEGTADTDWTPSTREDHRIAAMFARLASKVAEDMSYQRAPGDEFWDPRKIMRRQIDRRPLQHCKMDYTKRRLALLVDTSPSCRDEAVFYSKIATGALLRDDIDIFLCPNGRIDAHFDPEPMRFVDDDRGTEWALDGRVVLYFTDWDGSDEIVEHSRDCTLYWFDNCAPSDYWDSDEERRQRVRLRYQGQHFHCPDRSAFRRLARKIRP